jgi:hypothetical protein
MRKMPTLYKKMYAEVNGRSEFIGMSTEVTPGCEWVTDGYGWATRKWDGTPVARIGGHWYHRFDAKKDKAIPHGAIEITPFDGAHHMHWIPVTPATQHPIRDAIENYEMEFDVDYNQYQTYEAIGPKINGNREKFDYHTLIPHGFDVIQMPFRDFEGIRDYLLLHEIEGIVFHNDRGDMCKMRRKDYGIRW